MPNFELLEATNITNNLLNIKIMAIQIEKNCRITLKQFITRFSSVIYKYLIDTDDLAYRIYDVKEDNKCNDFSALLIMVDLGCFDFHKNIPKYTKLKKEQGY